MTGRGSGAGCERKPPILLCLTIDPAAPDITRAGRQRQRLHIDRYGEIKSCSWPNARRSTYLELAAHLNCLVTSGARNPNRLLVLSKERKPQVVSPVSLVPVYFDLQGNRHRDGTRSRYGPTAAKDVQLAADRLGGVGQQHGHPHLGLLH